MKQNDLADILPFEQSRALLHSADPPEVETGLIHLAQKSELPR